MIQLGKLFALHRNSSIPGFNSWHSPWSPILHQKWFLSTVRNKLWISSVVQKQTKKMFKYRKYSWWVVWGIGSGRKWGSSSFNKILLTFFAYLNLTRKMLEDVQDWKSTRVLTQSGHRILPDPRGFHQEIPETHLIYRAWDLFISLKFAEAKVLRQY